MAINNRELFGFCSTTILFSPVRFLFGKCRSFNTIEEQETIQKQGKILNREIKRGNVKLRKLAKIGGK